MKNDDGTTMTIAQKQHVLAHARTTDWMKDILLRPFANIITWPHANFSVTIADFARQWPRDTESKHIVRYTTPVADMHFLVLPRPEQKFTFDYCEVNKNSGVVSNNCNSGGDNIDRWDEDLSQYHTCTTAPSRLCATPRSPAAVRFRVTTVLC